jgi:hypothetical protein
MLCENPVMVRINGVLISTELKCSLPKGHGGTIHSTTANWPVTDPTGVIADITVGGN